MPAVLEPTAFPPVPSAPTLPSLPSVAQPLLREVPKLLEYRGEADPDAEFIPKTIAGFAGGFMLMGLCLVIANALLSMGKGSNDELFKTAVTYTVFLVGIAGVASSLLLVGLKVRADHNEENLFARHWLNSICTGAVYVMLVLGPWLLVEKQIQINRFVAAAIFMALMAVPVVAARWTVGPAAKRPGA